jgi:hypothetical protein
MELTEKERQKKRKKRSVEERARKSTELDERMGRLGAG